MLIQFDNHQLEVQPDPAHDWIMSTAQVASGYGVMESSIRSHKSRNASQLVEGKHYFSVANCNASGNQTTTYWTKRGVVRLGLKINSEVAKRFCDFAEDLIISQVQGPAMPRSYPEALRLYAAELEQRQELEQQLAIAKPKTEFYDAVVQSSDTADLGTVAKVLNIPGIGRTKLFAQLREEKVLMGDNKPYQEYQDRGWFRVVESSWNKPDGSRHVYFKTVVYQKGIDGIRRLLTKSTQLTAV